MTDLRTAAQQALDGVEALLTSMDVRHLLVYEEVNNAITALKAALAEPVQEPNVPETNFWHMVPVGWLENPFGSFRRNWLWKLDPPPKTLAWSIPLYAAPSQPAEPVQSTAWAHLPNAAHIDRIVAHAKEHPGKWDAAKDRGAALNAARGAARHEVWGAAVDAAWDAAVDAVHFASRDAAWDAIAALIAFDYAGELFSLPRFVVRAMADKGDHAAVLLYPAMLAMGEDK